MDDINADLLAQGFAPAGTVLACPPWRYTNRKGKAAPEHERLTRFRTLDLETIRGLPVGDLSLPESHLYLWVPNAMIAEGLDVMRAWGFVYKTNLVWLKVREDGEPDGRGMGFYFRNTTEMLLFGVRGGLRTLAPGRRQTNMMVAQRKGHSRKPEISYEIIEACSPGPRLELFARESRDGWMQWGEHVLQVHPPSDTFYQTGMPLGVPKPGEVAP